MREKYQKYAERPWVQDVVDTYRYPWRILLAHLAPPTWGIGETVIPIVLL